MHYIYRGYEILTAKSMHYIYRGYEILTAKSMHYTLFGKNTEEILEFFKI